MQNKTIFIMTAISGSGKTTLALQLLEKDPTLVICSADKYFIDSNGIYKFDASKLKNAHDQCYTEAGVALAKGFNVVVDNTGLVWEHSAKYVRLAGIYGYKVEFILFDAKEGDIPMLAERNRHGVPEAAIKRQYNNLVSLRKSLKRDMGTAFPGIKFTIVKQAIAF